MFNRPLFKDRAKLVLAENNNYWYAFAATTATYIISGLVTSAYEYFINLIAPYSDYAATLNQAASSSDIIGFKDTSPALLPIEITSGVIMTVSLVLIVASVIYSAFVSMPIRVGCGKFFLDLRTGGRNIGTIFYGFKNSYLNVVKVSFITDIIITLWSLLFIIPGIYVGYAYSLVPYLLAENPKMDGKTARELSKKITDGHKWDIFVLGLSFFGWILLGALCCGIGTYFVMPYREATFAEMYISIRDEAISSGKISYRDITDCQN